MSPIHDERFQGKRPEKKLDPQKFSILRTPDTTTEPVRGNASPVATVSVSSSRTRASKARFLAEGVGQDRPLTLDDHAALAYQAGFDERERQRQVAREREERERIAEAKEVARRLRSQGLEKLPDAYRWDLERLRSERK